MARYQPLPYVRPAREQTLRLGDLYLRQGEQIAEAERRRGEIQAQLWGQLGQVAGDTGAAMIQAPQLERERVAKEQERQAGLRAAGQLEEARGLELAEQRRLANDRQSFDRAMGAGSRAQTLEALKGQPELYAKAQSHFDAIDTSMKKLMGDVAAGVADFGYTPEAAVAALDDLIEQGFDPARMTQYRDVITADPGRVKTLVQSLLAQSPDPRHQALAKPQLTEVSPGATLVDPRNPGEAIFTAPNRAPVPKSLQAKDVLLDGKPVVANFDPASGRFSVNGQDVTERVKPIPPQGPAGGEPLEAVIGDDGNPELVPRSQARGRRPATSREQPTEDERKSAGWLKQIEGAIATMDALEDKLTEAELYQIQTLPQEALIGLVNRNKLSENAKRYFQAFEEFTEARLRSVSGATITPQEEARDRRIYAKQFGETPELASQRRASRGRAQDALRSRAGRALPKPSHDDARPGDIEYDSNGNRITKKGGS